MGFKVWQRVVWAAHGVAIQLACRPDSKLGACTGMHFCANSVLPRHQQLQVLLYKIVACDDGAADWPAELGLKEVARLENIPL